jgi:hypothetical protein
VAAPVEAPARIHAGDEDLEVVGESHYQSGLWSSCGGTQGDRVRHPIVAVLVPEPDNPYDPLAIAVQIEGCLSDISLVKRPPNTTLASRA